MKYSKTLFWLGVLQDGYWICNQFCPQQWKKWKEILSAYQMTDGESDCEAEAIGP